ncbi:TetR family transcriptional regulator [Bradyrhizobium sp. SSBR45G]|uniref:TetR/AcrR family transcriptional regulator n=1 Tax=unclassified Bradyrhizobium TaxID=2631580 RepID=UPI002342B921|nr:MULTISPECIES: TetR/AcrR family transcriptional regulator [unclassified Bradyrhizobium]GLH77838.1 TetR family transcriptional regulator [Bradyrhizobium sp. SSBR45G]GLH85540.1 TetR family transcriptional regulator [Bradyrhizobium sp. SSBR45R]
MARPAKTPRKTYHHGDLRNALLTAAREVLEERGPSFLGLREISRRVGVSAPSAYHHFPSRDAIALGLAEQGAAELAACLAAAPPNPGGSLLTYGEAYIAFVRANPALYRLMFGEGFPAVSEHSAAIRALRTRSYEIMKASLESRLTAAELPIAGLFLWALVHGLGLLLIDRQIVRDDDLNDVIRRVLTLAGTGLMRGPGRHDGK